MNPQELLLSFSNARGSIPATGHDTCVGVWVIVRTYTYLYIDANLRTWIFISVFIGHSDCDGTEQRERTFRIHYLLYISIKLFYFVYNIKLRVYGGCYILRCNEKVNMVAGLTNDYEIFHDIRSILWSGSKFTLQFTLYHPKPYLYDRIIDKGCAVVRLS